MADKFITRLTPEDDAILKKILKKTGLTKTDIFRNAIREYEKIVFADSIPTYVETYFTKENKPYDKCVLSLEELRELLIQDIPSRNKDVRYRKAEDFISTLTDSDTLWDVQTFDGSKVMYRLATEEEITEEIKRREAENANIQKLSEKFFEG